MAQFAPTKIIVPGNQPYNRIDMNFWRLSNGDTAPNGTPYYAHIKTNIARYSDVMYMIEAVGYNYGASQSIRCAFTGYMYDDSTRPGITIYQPTQFQAYPGLTADGQYLSSDNFLVLRVYSSTMYYAGFSLNCYQVNPISATVSPQVSAVTLNSSSGAAF